jgi:hypothetical protein
VDSSFLFFMIVGAGTLIILGVILAFLLSKILKNLRGRGAGWTNLMERLPTSGPIGNLFKKQTVQVGKVVYKRCTTVGISPQGLYLEVSIPFSSRLKPLFIPWEMVKGVKEGSLYWEKTRILSIGEPEIGTIAVFADLFERIRPYLKI